MYLIYLLNNQEQTLKVLAFTDTIEKAKIMMTESAKEFIIENEGKKKLDSVFQDENTEISKLIDGYYFVKKENRIDIYKKENKLSLQSGWLGSYQNIQHTYEKIGAYYLVEFDNSMLNQFIDTAYVDKNVIAQETKIKKITTTIPTKFTKTTKTIMSKSTVSRMDDVLAQLVKNGFKNHLKPVVLNKSALNQSSLNQSSLNQSSLNQSLLNKSKQD
jgi:hypothetical protein